MKLPEALGEIRAQLPELKSWRDNRAAKRLDTSTLDRVIALLYELQTTIEATMGEYK